MITFFVPGTPKALKRHRAFMRGRHAVMVDPSKGDKADFLTIAMQAAPSEPLRCPLTLVLEFRFPRPKSHFGTGRKCAIQKPGAPNYHTAKPDIDNLQKFVCDALNGVFWHDDSYVCQVIAKKVYSDQPGVSVTIRTTEEV